MILDYSEYVTERGSKGIVNYVRVDNGAALFTHDSTCPFCQKRIDTKVYSVHKLRHTAATLMYKYGHVDIRNLQQILGHQSVSTTQIYTHVDDEQLQKAIDSNPLAGFKPD